MVSGRSLTPSFFGAGISCEDIALKTPLYDNYYGGGLDPSEEQVAGSHFYPRYPEGGGGMSLNRLGQFRKSDKV